MDKIHTEIITIGDEILSGIIADTNSAMIARKLQATGILVNQMVSVGDDPDAIEQLMIDVAARARLAIVTGGLGPTEDDRTVQAVSDAFGLPVVIHQPSLEKIKARFKALGVEYTENNARQARIPEGSIVVENPVGLAAGFTVEREGCILFFLPGVPRELERMLDESVVPMVREKFAPGTVILSRFLKIFGLGESRIDLLVKGALDGLNGIVLASLPRFPENKLRITASSGDPDSAARLLAEAEKRLRERVGGWIYGVDDQEMESVVEDLLREKGQTLAVAESCTGGLISHRLTNVPGSSEVFDRGIVSYSNQAKQTALGIPGSIIDGPGPVSEQTAKAMAHNVREQAGTTLGLSVTGVAGPGGGTESTPVGTVFIGLSSRESDWCKRYFLRRGRDDIKALASTTALDCVRRFLLGDGPFNHTYPWETN